MPGFFSTKEIPRVEIHVSIDADGSAAVVSSAEVSAGGQRAKLDAAVVREALQAQGVAAGFDEKSLTWLVEELRAKGRFRGSLIIAKERLPTPPSETAKQEWHSNQGDIVLSGTLLCRSVSASPGQAGYRVTGKPVEVPPFKPTAEALRALCQPGEGVKVASGGLEMLSSAFGRVTLVGQRLSVVPCFRRSADGDRIIGDLVATGPDGRDVGVDVVRRAVAGLLGAGVFLEDEVRRGLLEARTSNQVIWNVTVAEGKSPTSGEDARLVPKTENGAFVLPGELVAMRKPATVGADGRRINGSILPAESGKDVQLVDMAGDNVQPSMAKDGIKVLVASVLGEVHFDEDKVWIVPGVVVEADDSLAAVSFSPKSAYGQLVTKEHLMEALMLAKVQHGILEDKLEVDVAEAHATGERQERHIVACATPPQEEVANTFEFFFREDGLIPLWPPPEGDLLAVDEPSDPKFVERRRELVDSDTVLVQKKDGSPGVPGTTVKGEAILPLNSSVDMQTGANVLWDAKERVFRARLPGFPCLHGQMLSVDPLFDVAPDGSVVKIRLFPPSRELGKTNTAAIAALETQIREILSNLGVTQAAVDDHLIDAVIAAVKTGEVVEHTVVARGSEPVPPEPGRVEFLIDLDDHPGEILEDKRIDFRERHAVIAVAAGEAIAKLTPPRPGRPGLDVFGKVTVATLPDPPPLVEAGQNVEIKDGLLVATSDGAIRRQGAVILVTPIFVVDGDVGYDVGNIRFEGAVQIKGDVGEIFEVSVGGPLEVGGLVDGAKITCEDDLTIQGGILGKGKALVRCQGTLTTKYIDNATVEVQGDLVVQSHIYQSTILCDGRVTVEGTIAGGRVEAFKGIRGGTLGGAANPATLLIPGRSTHFSQEIERYERDLDQAIETRIKLVTVLKRLTRGQGPAALASLPHAQRQVAVRVAASLKALESEREELEVALEALRDEVKKSAVLKVRAEKMVHEGVTVRIHDRSRRVDEQIPRGVCFELGEDGSIVQA